MSGSIAAAAATVALLMLASPASAAFHFMRVREVFPGTTASPNSDYVELQMYSAGQNFVAGHPVNIYNQAGALTTFTFPGDVANGANQSTILVGASSTVGTGGNSATPDFVNSGIQLSAAGGAVCFPDSDQGGECVAWGTFTPPAGGLPAPGPGPPAPAIPDGQALRRSIAAGCSTLLEGSDDTDNSANDFALVAPNPRPNSVPPTETVCAPPPSAPTLSGTNPSSPANDNNPEVLGTAQSGSTVTLYQTSDCTGPVEATGSATQLASPGITATVADNSTNRFSATATTSGGTSPCSAAITYVESTPPDPGPDPGPPPPPVDADPPQTTLRKRPPGRTPDRTPTFRFGADEVGSTFQCKLDRRSYRPCASPFTAKRLSIGPHTLRVRSIDPAGNRDATPAKDTFRIIGPPGKRRG